MIGIRILCYIASAIFLVSAWTSDGHPTQIALYQIGFFGCVLALVATFVVQARFALP